MKILIDFAKDTKKIKNISLGVKANNTKARNLYSNFGFKEVGFHKNFFYVNDEYCNYGVSEQPVEDGDKFSIVYTLAE